MKTEPSPEAEEKQRWEQRLEHLQRAVAQLEVDRSRLQHHNAQLRTTLEQVGDSGLSSRPVRRKARISTSAATTVGAFGNNSPGPDLACSPFLKIKLSGDAPVFVTKIEWPTVPEVLQKRLAGPA